MAFQKPTRRRNCRGTCRGHSASHVLAGRRSYERRCQWWSEVSGRGSAPILLATPRESGPDILTRGWNDVTPAFPPDRASSADHLAGRTSCWNNETQDHRLRRHQSAPTRTNSSDRRDSRDGATRRADDPGPSTNVGYIHRKESAMTQPPQQPPTQVFAQQRRSGCGTILVALLVLAVITAIVIFLGAFGLLDWIYS